MMSDPMDPTRQHGAQPQSVSPEMLQELEEFLEDGRPVFDLNGEPVGGVKMYSIAAGYLFVLSEPKDELVTKYTEPPTVHTFVENQHTPGLQQRDTLPPADEVRAVTSGYDSMPTVVNSIELSNIAERLSVGLAVYDVDGVLLGDITQCDTECCLLMVEKGIFKPTVLIVPFSAIRSIDRDARSAILTLPRATLVQDQATLRSQLE